MKEHLGPVTSLRMKSDDKEVVSSSGDGSIIIWCLKKFIRKAVVLQDTLFFDVAWHPSECQVSYYKTLTLQLQILKVKLLGRWSHFQS